MTDDLISRQAALDALGKDPMGGLNYESILGSLPSVQPEKRTETHAETHACDLISRRAAIDRFEPWLKVDGYSEGELNMLKAVLYELRVMPPAQPETAKRIVGKSRDGMTLWYQCDMCNEPVDAKDNYCRGCGRRLTDG